MDKLLANYCISNLNLNSPHYAQPYQSLPVCIIDCIYSLRTKYFAVTVPTVERYAEKYMKNNRFSNQITISKFIKQIEDCGGCTNFAKDILHNNQQSGRVLKSEICYTLAQYMQKLKIETLTDFQNFDREILEIIIKSIKGIGDAGLNYLFMLAGDQNRCKPDVHIHHCIKDACGTDVSNDYCQELLTNTVAILRKSYPNLTVARLDGIIWNKYQSKK